MHIDAYGNFTDAVDGSKVILLGAVDLSRDRGKPQSENINKLFYVDVEICTAVDATGACTAWAITTLLPARSIPRQEENCDGKPRPVRMVPERSWLSAGVRPAWRPR